MLDKIDGVVAPATGLPEGRLAQTSVAGLTDALPTVGRGSQLEWANSWSELSTKMRSVGLDVEALAQRSASVQSPQEMMSSMGEMLRASRHLTESSVQFQLVTGVVTNAASAVNKLLTQQ